MERHDGTVDHETLKTGTPRDVPGRPEVKEGEQRRQDRRLQRARQVQREPFKQVFQRCECNPLLEPADMPVPAMAVLNPGATEHNGDVALLLRVEGISGYSNIHVARSSNGLDNWSVDPEPILQFGLPGLRYEKWGCEDARIVHLEEEDAWYITYTAYSPAGSAVGLARSTDLKTAERVGLIFSPNNKDAVFFPCRFEGRWAALHRPEAGGGIENIWIAYSKDLVYWGEPHCVLQERAGPAWDATTVGAGPPPIETDRGWLLLYHGVKMYGGRRVYRVGAALLDRDRPHKVLARTSECIFKPTASYEFTGLLPNVVFPTGTLVRGDELWMYYGAADTCVCMAKAHLSDILQALERPDPDGQG